MSSSGFSTHSQTPLNSFQSIFPRIPTIHPPLHQSLQQQEPNLWVLMKNGTTVWASLSHLRLIPTLLIPLFNRSQCLPKSKYPPLLSLFSLPSQKEPRHQSTLITTAFQGPSESIICQVCRVTSLPKSRRLAEVLGLGYVTYFTKNEPPHLILSQVSRVAIPIMCTSPHGAYNPQAHLFKITNSWIL